MAMGMVEEGLFRSYCYSNSKKKGSAKGGGGKGDWREEARGLVGPGKRGVGVMIVSCYGNDWRGYKGTKTSRYQTSCEGSVCCGCGGPVNTYAGDQTK